MGNLAQLDQETGLGVNCLIKFDKILLIGIGGVNNRCLQSPRSSFANPSLVILHAERGRTTPKSIVHDSKSLILSKRDSDEGRVFEENQYKCRQSLGKQARSLIRARLTHIA